MSIRIFHTGDLHIGMKFNNYPKGVREYLCEARFTALENMINRSNDLNADIFVVAGDLFNTIQVAKKDIKRVVAIMNKFNGACVLVLPGNHDYDNGGIDLWKVFEDAQADNVLVINEERPYILEDYDLDALIYPAPCHSKHSEENSLQWIKDQGLSDTGKYHIGIAHGALEGLSPDVEGNYYYMTMDELQSIPMDLWLLGHTHVAYPTFDRIENHNIYNAGTPEPDGMDYREEGSSWLIDLEDGGVVGQRIITGEYCFYDKEFELDAEDQLEDIRNWVLKDDPGKKLIRLSLIGSIPREAYRGLNDFYEDLMDKVFHINIEDSKLRVKVNKETIEREFTKGSFPYEFLNGLSHDEEALQIAYDLLRRE